MAAQPPKRVLVATNDRTFAPSLVAAYAARGWEVATGVDNLFHRSAAYDLVHLHWPEELVDWHSPSRSELDRVASAMTWWKDRTCLLSTAHNLLPHGRELSQPDRDLYRIVYGSAEIIAHFSHYSAQRVSQEFPEIEAHKHVVHRPFLLTDLQSYRRGREAARKDLGVRDEEFAILAFGAFRQDQELRLFHRGVAKANLARKCTVFAARPPTAGLLERGLRWARLELRKQSERMITFSELYVPDEKVAMVFEAADAVVITRSPPHLNSGILPLAMTFGTPLVAPRYGIYSEYLADTENELYEPGDACDLAVAIERLAKRDRNSVTLANRDCASEWGWPGILEMILPKLFEVPPNHAAAMPSLTTDLRGDFALSK